MADWGTAHCSWCPCEAEKVYDCLFTGEYDSISGQPLVVQHPQKNVFSVSQRVSRIFELDDDLGHDDTLQLVLNVMATAGKEARRVRGPRAPLPPPTTETNGGGGSSSGAAGNGSADPRDNGSLLMNANGVNVTIFEI